MIVEATDLEATVVVAMEKLVVSGVKNEGGAGEHIGGGGCGVGGGSGLGC